MAILALKIPASTKDVEISAAGIVGKGVKVYRMEVLEEELDKNHVQQNSVNYASSKVAAFLDAKKAFGKELAAMIAGPSLKSVSA
jgi:hypothetical protein